LVPSPFSFLVVRLVWFPLRRLFPVQFVFSSMPV
jgi:hypothetical protein